MMMKKELEFAKDTSFDTAKGLYLLAKMLLVCIRLALKNKPKMKTATILNTSPSKFHIKMAKISTKTLSLYLKKILFKKACEMIKDESIIASPIKASNKAASLKLPFCETTCTGSIKLNTAKVGQIKKRLNSSPENLNFSTLCPSSFFSSSKLLFIDIKKLTKAQRAKSMAQRSMIGLVFSLNKKAASSGPSIKEA